MRAFTYKIFILTLVSLSLFGFDNPKNKKISKHVAASVKKHDFPKDNPYYIIITKSTYELKVYDQEGWYATYPVVFGSRDLGDKMYQGDKKTPEGHFRIVLKKIHSKWGPEMLLDYPNEESREKFLERKAKGLIPKNKSMGDGIAIHATRPDEEWTVDVFQNWTDGCISLKYTEAQDLFSYIPEGTPVTIER
jgi:murein L,D-transpeptidase YafK